MSEQHAMAGHHQSHAGHLGHEASPTLAVDAEGGPVEAGRPADVRLTISRGEGRIAADFDVVHEEKVHLIVVREGLDHFMHVHPRVVEGGSLSATLRFPAGGRYLLFADHKPSGGRQATAIGELQVGGTAPEAPALVPDVPGTVTGDGLSADVSVGTPGLGGTTTIRFHVMDPSGAPVADLAPYLGAMGHLVILSADGRQYVHAHATAPEEDPAVVAFEAHFPSPGVYKAWGQFRRGDAVHTIPFVTDIMEADA